MYELPLAPSFIVQWVRWSADGKRLQRFPSLLLWAPDARAPLLSRRLDYPHFRDRAKSRHDGAPTLPPSEPTT